LEFDTSANSNISASTRTNWVLLATQPPASQLDLPIESRLEAVGLERIEKSYNG